MISKMVHNESLLHKVKSMKVIESSTYLNQIFYARATTIESNQIDNTNGPPCIDSVSDYVCINSTQVVLIVFTGSIFFLAGCIHLIIYSRRGRANGHHQTTHPIVRSQTSTTTTARMTLSVLQDVPPRYSQIFAYTNDVVTTVDESPPAYDTVVTVTVQQTSYNIDIDKLSDVPSVPRLSPAQSSARIENVQQPSSAIFAIDPAQLESSYINVNSSRASQPTAPNGKSADSTIV